MGCEPAVDDATGLEALREPLRAVGGDVVRIQDPELTTSYRNLAATWLAAIGE